MLIHRNSQDKLEASWKALLIVTVVVGGLAVFGWEMNGLANAVILPLVAVVGVAYVHYRVTWFNKETTYYVDREQKIVMAVKVLRNGFWKLDSHVKRHGVSKSDAAKFRVEVLMHLLMIANDKKITLTVTARDGRLLSRYRTNLAVAQRLMELPAEKHRKVEEIGEAVPRGVDVVIRPVPQKTDSSIQEQPNSNGKP